MATNKRSANRAKQSFEAAIASADPTALDKATELCHKNLQPGWERSLADEQASHAIRNENFEGLALLKDRFELDPELIAKRMDERAKRMGERATEASDELVELFGRVGRGLAHLYDFDSPSDAMERAEYLAEHCDPGAMVRARHLGFEAANLTPLMACATAAIDGGAFETLLDRSDPNQQNEKGTTALMLLACSKFQDEGVWDTLSKRSDAGLVDSQGMTALHHAARRSDAGLLNILMRDHPKALEAADHNGMSALHHAIDSANRHESVDTIEALIDRVDVRRVDRFGSTAADRCRDSGWPDIQALASRIDAVSLAATEREAIAEASQRATTDRTRSRSL